MRATEAVRQRAGTIFFGWWIVAGAVAMQALQLGLLSQAYGVYISALEADFGWSKTSFSLASAAQRAESGRPPSAPLIFDSALASRRAHSSGDRDMRCSGKTLRTQ